MKTEICARLQNLYKCSHLLILCLLIIWIHLLNRQMRNILIITIYNKDFFFNGLFYRNTSDYQLGNKLVLLVDWLSTQSISRCWQLVNLKNNVNILFFKLKKWFLNTWNLSALALMVFSMSNMTKERKEKKDRLNGVIINGRENLPHNKIFLSNYKKKKKT